MFVAAKIDEDLEASRLNGGGGSSYLTKVRGITFELHVLIASPFCFTSSFLISNTLGYFVFHPPVSSHRTTRLWRAQRQ